MSRASGSNSGVPREIEAALATVVPTGEFVVWHGRPSVSDVVEREAKSGWQRAAILGGGYSVIGGCIAAWTTGQPAWMAIPLVVLAICGVGLWRESRRGSRLADVLKHTAYALTIHKAIVVQSRPSVQCRMIELANSATVHCPDPDSGLSDLLFQTPDGQHLVFADIQRGADVEALVEQLKSEPDAIAQQFQLVAQWGELYKQYS
jgi:hypothetical protein